MSLNQSFLAEVLYESANTRKLLEKIPFDKADFKPHEKSMSLKRLAVHVTEITAHNNLLGTKRKVYIV